MSALPDRCRIAYWHVYLTNDVGTWAGIVTEQLGIMKCSGLLEALEAFKITAISRPDSAPLFEGLVRSIYPKAEIEWVQNPFLFDLEMLNELNTERAVTENHTIRKIYKDCLDSDHDVLYFHTKGITADLRYLRTGDFDTYRNYYFWRKHLNWGVLKTWQTASYLFERLNYGVVGANFQNIPVPHYSGAFWWAQASHIRTLPDPSTLDWWKALQASTDDAWLKTCSERHRDELWICQSDTSKYYDLSLPNKGNPASSFVFYEE